MPCARSTAHSTSSSGSATSDTSSAVGTAPIAATSATFWAATLTPTSWALDHSSCQSRPRTIESVVATTAPPGEPTTAASSPGPTGTEPQAGGRAPAYTGNTRASSSPSLTSRSRT